MSHSDPDKYKRWKRPGEITKTFQEDKYQFSKYLTDVGDYVETFPMPVEDQVRMRYAAHRWAYDRKWTISFRRYWRPDGRVCRVTLVKKHRIRDFT
jgi:hypothetical protein